MVQHYGSQGNSPDHLAWHETLELHELAVFQSNGLMALKKTMPQIQDPALRTIYGGAIQGVEQNLKELLQFYPSAPDERQSQRDLNAFYSGSLLGFAKTSVRNYAIAITETATPQLREVLQTHLLRAIQLHGKVYYYMYNNGYYPSYNLQQLLANDVKIAKNALSLPTRSE